MHIDDRIESISKALENSKLSLWDRAAYNYSLRQSQEDREEIRIGTTLIATEIPGSRRLKTRIEQWASKGLIYSASNANDPHVPVWRQVYSVVNALTYNNLNFAASFIPVTSGEAALTFVPMTRTAPVIKALHALNPANIYRWGARTGRVGNINVHPQLHFDYSAPEAAFTLRIDPLTGRGPMHIDSRLFTSATSTTKVGAARNQKQFWDLWAQKYPETLSPKNLEVISSGKAPFVDPNWVSHLPEHQHYLGDVLIHHHIDHSHLTVALPKELHGTKPGFSIFHTH